MRRWVFACCALALAVAPFAAHATEYTGIPSLHSITTVHSAIPCMDQSVRLVAEGRFDSCGTSLGHGPGPQFTITAGLPCLGDSCAYASRTWSDTLELGLLPVGHYHAEVKIAEVDLCVASPETTVYVALFDFDVLACPPNPIEHLDFVSVRSASDTSRAPCAGDSIRVTLSGSRSSCEAFRGVRILPPETAGPPIVQLIFDNLCCAGVVCDPLIVPWSTVAILPPLPGGGYDLTVEAAEVCCRDSVIPGDPRGRRTVPFVVSPAESCGVPSPACLLVAFDHSKRVGDCDTGFDGNGQARLTLGVASGVALAGLQGNLRVIQSNGLPGGLMITGLEPVGAATGMHLTWTPEPGGARYVLFSDHDAPIPPASLEHLTWPVLRATFQHVPTAAGTFAPDSTREWLVLVDRALGADAQGQGVVSCNPGAPPMLGPPGTICTVGTCDLNGDAHADVRDLVLAVRCLNHTGGCPADTLGMLDCDENGVFDLDDVLCCARAVLGVPPCPGCGDSSRADPAISVTFGAPVTTLTGVDVPIHLVGAHGVGAARFELQIPTSDVAAASVTMPSRSDWISLDSWSAGRVTVGLIGLSTAQARGGVPGDDVDLTLHLGFAPGASPAGQVALGSSDFSGNDGIRLRTGFDPPVVHLGPGVSVTLAAAQPNPFATGTLLRLTLDAETTLDFGIYDLAGRRLRVLHSGPLSLGVHPFVWDGRRDDGTPVRSGVYFARVSMARGATTVQKLVMVRGE